MSKQNPQPTLRDVLDARVQQAMTVINCVSIGTIQAFDAATQTATVSINYQRTIKDGVPNPAGDPKDKIVPYPLLIQCPVVIMNGGGAFLTFPIAKGDTCVLLFNDREIDTWFTTGNTDKPPASGRTHDLSDAVAMVGVRSMANKISGYDASKVKLMFGSGYITIDSSGNIAVNSPGTINVVGPTINVTGTTITIAGSSQVAINP